MATQPQAAQLAALELSQAMEKMLTPRSGRRRKSTKPSDRGSSLLRDDSSSAPMTTPRAMRNDFASTSSESTTMSRVERGSTVCQSSRAGSRLPRHEFSSASTMSSLPPRVMRGDFASSSSESQTVTHVERGSTVCQSSRPGRYPPVASSAPTEAAHFVEYPGQRLAMRPSSTTSSTTSLVVAHVEFDPEHQRPRRNAWRTGTEPAGFNRTLGMRLEDALPLESAPTRTSRRARSTHGRGSGRRQLFSIPSEPTDASLLRGDVEPVQRESGHWSGRWAFCTDGGASSEVKGAQEDSHVMRPLESGRPERPSRDGLPAPTRPAARSAQDFAAGEATPHSGVVVPRQPDRPPNRPRHVRGLVGGRPVGLLGDLRDKTSGPSGSGARSAEAGSSSGPAECSVPA